MEQGTVVALFALAGSFLTVLVTGAFNTLAKWIDSQQKTKDHQLSIRSIYVTKKIEAGQLLILDNNKRIWMYSSTQQFFYFLLMERNINIDLYEHLLAAFKTSHSSENINTSFYDLYYDTREYTDKISEATDSINELIGKINPYLEDRNIADENGQIHSDLQAQLIILLDKNSQALEACYEINNVVRKNLSNYDIL